MNLKKLSLCLLLFSGFHTQIFAAENKVKIAVGNFEINGMSKVEGKILIDRIIYEFGKYDEVRVMERAQMDEILMEQSFQQSEACDAKECQITLGKLLGVDQIIVGSISVISGGLNVISARSVDVETGEILKSVNEENRGSIELVLREMIPLMVRRLLNKNGLDSGQIVGVKRFDNEPVDSIDEMKAEPAHLLDMRVPIFSKVQLNGEDVDWEGSRLLTQGAYNIRVSKKHYETWVSDIYLDSPQKIDVEIKMSPFTFKQKASIIFVGASIASALFGYSMNQFGLDWKKEYPNANSKDQAQALYEKVEFAKTARNVSYVVSIAALVSGVVLWQF